MRAGRQCGYVRCSRMDSMLEQTEATVIENVILGVFLVLPLLIVAFLFSDELWQEHRHLHDMRPLHAKPRRLDWRHPLRRSRHRL
ncbi:hypothetical protein LMG9964_04589 [Paraburkholderia phenoliruptrix]|uniref:Uncharacterized protein n=3 Tax=Paraburkholderia phenoliruptrix TaxID=252970 RepID=K0DSH1_9BURK|nr:hypothetical protein BUPH_06673 [Paraburkholderia phenoliruptrix BR3459a]CAB4050922.1 hypothetical protein LMG9964_04589 [Paraburkholderia phenoliruptrix]